MESLEDEKNAQNGKKKRRRRRRRKRRKNAATEEENKASKVCSDAESQETVNDKGVHKLSITRESKCEICGESGGEFENKWTDAELLFLETLGWSEQTRNAWEAEPLPNDQSSPKLEMVQKE